MRRLCGYHIFSIGLLAALFLIGLFAGGIIPGIVSALLGLVPAVAIFFVEVYFAPEEPTLFYGGDRTIPPHPW